MIGRIHEKTDRFGKKTIIVGICDKELLGKRLKQGEVVLDLEKHADFYQGTELTQELAGEWIRQGKNLNLVGKKTIAAARKVMRIDGSRLKTVKGVPHLQVYYL